MSSQRTSGITFFMMISPRYTVIIAVPFFSAKWCSLNALLENPPVQATQILLAVGRHPSRQRNAALELATGEIAVFLDSDSVPDDAFWRQLDSALENPKVDVVGGPALLRKQATLWERIFHTQLSHPLVVGPLASRYASLGAFRRSSQAELILCNLAVRRSLFIAVGGFSPDLYPNEENEWLDRAARRNAGIFYDPDLIIRRGFPERLGHFLGMIFRNGRGRTHQSLLVRRVSNQQYLVLGAGFFLFILLLVTIWQGVGVLLPLILLWFGMALFVFWTSESSQPMGIRLGAGVLAPLIPLSYALGQVAGFFQEGPGLRDAPIEVVNELGDLLATFAPASTENKENVDEGRRDVHGRT